MSTTRAGTLADQTTVHPPTGLFYAAACCALLSVLLVFPFTIISGVVGYLLTPIASTVLISIYRAQDIRRQQSVWYIPNFRQRQLVPLLLALSFIVGSVHAWAIATEIAKWAAS